MAVPGFPRRRGVRSQVGMLCFVACAIVACVGLTSIERIHVGSLWDECVRDYRAPCPDRFHRSDAHCIAPADYAVFTILAFTILKLGLLVFFAQ